MSQILKYSVIKNKTTEVVYRVLKLNVPSKVAVLIRLNTEEIDIIHVSLESMEADYRVIEDNQYTTIKDTSLLSESEQRIFEMRCKVVDYIAENFNEEELYFSKTRKKIIAQVLEQKLIGKTSLYKFLNMYPAFPTSL